MKRLLLGLVLVAGLGAPAFAQPADPGETKVLHALFEEQWETGLRRAPERATRKLVDDFQDFAYAIDLVWPGLRPPEGPLAALVICAQSARFNDFLPAGLQPGEVTTRSTSSGSEPSQVGPRRRSAPRISSNCARSAPSWPPGADSSSTVTSAPRCSNVSAAAKPLIPKPHTTARVDVQSG